MCQGVNTPRTALDQQGAGTGGQCSHPLCQPSSKACSTWLLARFQQDRAPAVPGLMTHPCVGFPSYPFHSPHSLTLFLESSPNKPAAGKLSSQALLSAGWGQGDQLKQGNGKNVVPCGSLLSSLLKGTYNNNSHLRVISYVPGSVRCP